MADLRALVEEQVIATRTLLNNGNVVFTAPRPGDCGSADRGGWRRSSVCRPITVLTAEEGGRRRQNPWASGARPSAHTRHRSERAGRPGAAARAGAAELGAGALALGKRWPTSGATPTLEEPAFLAVARARRRHHVAQLGHDDEVEGTRGGFGVMASGPSALSRAHGRTPAAPGNTPGSAADTAALKNLAYEASAPTPAATAALEKLTAEDYRQTDVRGATLPRAGGSVRQEPQGGHRRRVRRVEVNYYADVAVMTGHWTYTRQENGRRVVPPNRVDLRLDPLRGWKRRLPERTSTRTRIAARRAFK
jgi:hypothetical protein